MASTLPAIAGSPYGAIAAPTVDTLGFLENTQRGVKTAAFLLKKAIAFYVKYQDVINRALDLLAAHGNTDAAALKTALVSVADHRAALIDMNFPGVG